MGLRPTKGNENPGCPISRAFFAREVGIFDRAKPKGSRALASNSVFLCGLLGYKISGNNPGQFVIQIRRHSSGNCRGMKIPSSSDRETLQQLLANAFAVQESQINARCLSDIMEVQRAVRSGKLSLDGAMRHIVESARTVANATGIAIALIDAGHLRYRAGSGSSAVCIGWRVAASLTASASTRTNREILRVEDAQTDTRIEADICRQFGANSLLILPIYFQGAVAGVLDVRFSEPHVFDDPEVRTYRLMAEQIEAALSLTAQQEPQENLAAELPAISEVFDPVPADGANFVSPAEENFALPHAENYEDFETFVPPPDFTMLPENEHSLYARCGAVLADIMKLPVFKQLVWLASRLTQPPATLDPRRFQRFVVWIQTSSPDRDRARPAGEKFNLAWSLAAHVP